MGITSRVGAGRRGAVLPPRSRLLAVAVAGLLSVLSLLVPAPAHAADGSAWTVGLGSDGQLGTGGTTSRLTYGPVQGLGPVTEIAGGREHVLALDGAGAVWSWGDGSKGALGYGSLTDRRAPGLVPGLPQVSQVAAGHYHSLALLADGTVRGWGMNSLGQLGDGTTSRRTSPVRVSGLSDVVFVAGGRDASYAVLADGTVRAWGGGANGELGNGTVTTRQTTSVRVGGATPLDHVLQVAAGRNHAIALMDDGTLRAWGLNTSGQLGDGTRTTRTTPVVVRGSSGAAVHDVIQVTAGALHSVALLADGTVLTWGEGSRGQLGSGSKSDRLLAATVTGLPLIARVGNGRDHTVAITQGAGDLYAWGMNDYGQLGDGTTTNRLRPVRVPGVAGATQAGGGRGYTVLLRAL
jgi:alpha-tubulin suppressor-like RCC1 family protein